LSGGGIAAAGGAERAREQRHRPGVGKFAVGRIGKRRGLAPLVALDGVARRDCRARIGRGAPGIGEADRYFDLGEGVAVTAQLEVG
jgi:hypothetical protein